MFERSVVITPDDSQRAAIEARDPGIRIIAPAGSGKTFTIIQHVIDRIERDGMDPNRILMLSFDTSALDSYRAHLSRHLHGKDLPDLMTFGDLSGVLYRRHVRSDVHASKRSRPYFQALADEQGLIPLLEEAPHAVTNDEAFFATKRYGIPISTQISAKERERFPGWFTEIFLGLPSDHFDSREDERAPMLEDFLNRYRAYQESLIDAETGVVQYEAIDIELALTSILREQTAKARGIRKEVQARYDVIVVDEAQDISRLDAVLLNRILRPDATLLIAGDDDQTIHEATFADSRFLRQANELFQRSLRDYPLGVNYRTPGRILDRAQELVKANDVRRSKPVISSRPDAGVLQTHRITRADDRASTVASIITAVRNRPNTTVAWRDIVILVPDDEKARTIASYLRAEGMAVARTGSHSAATPRDKIQILPLRRAKGRGWKIVIVPWCSDDDIPSESARMDDQIDGERRLFYVTMTRAAEQLHLLYVQASGIEEVKRSASGTVYGTSGASRFLFEAGILTDHAERTQSDPTLGRLPDRERKNFRRFERCMASDDTEGALGAGFTVVEWALTQLQRRDPHLQMLRLTALEQIRELSNRDATFARTWKDPLHRWRMARNAVSHADGNTISPEELTVTATEMGRLLPTFLQRVLDQHPGPSSQAAPDLQRDILAKVTTSPTATTTPQARTEAAPPPKPTSSRPPTAKAQKPDIPPAPKQTRLMPVPTENVIRIATWLARGGYDPKTQKPIRTVPIHPRTEGVEYLPLQLALILTDVPFHIRKSFRYTESPIFAHFCAQNCTLSIPQQLHEMSAQPTPAHLAPHEAAITALLSDVLQTYASRIEESAPSRMLRSRLYEAVYRGNGESPSGIRFVTNRKPDDEASGR
ncbi:MAG: UvrD-helicase domain-containing protein [Thermomicrobiales bacterium]